MRAAEEVVMEQGLIRMTRKASLISWLSCPCRPLRFPRWWNWPGGPLRGKPATSRSNKLLYYRLQKRLRPRMSRIFLRQADARSLAEDARAFQSGKRFHGGSRRPRDGARRRILGLGADRCRSRDPAALNPHRATARSGSLPSPRPACDGQGVGGKGHRYRSGETCP